MNLSYFKKCKYSKEGVLENLKTFADKNKLNILGQIDLPQTGGVLIQICSDSWLDKILKNDKNLVGLIPCNILVIEKDGVVSVGSGNPAILNGVATSSDIQFLVAEAENKMRNLINEVSGAGEQVPQTIKLYSTMSCPYCNMEKVWLDSNNIEHIVIYVDRDQKEAERMVKNTGQMGVPVTEIEYDDGEVEYIVGFDKDKLNSILKKKQ